MYLPARTAQVLVRDSLLQGVQGGCSGVYIICGCFAGERSFGSPSWYFKRCRSPEENDGSIRRRHTPFESNLPFRKNRQKFAEVD